MSEAKDGDSVKVHYVGKLNNGLVFDSSEGREPLEFKIGDGMVIPGFEQAVFGMNVGEKRNISIAPQDAYGDYQQDRVITIARTELPAEIQPEVGQVLENRQEDGMVVRFLITNLDEEQITLDANHPLAGQQLNFEIELMEII